MKQTATLILIIALLAVPLGTVGAQEDDARLIPCTAEDIAPMMDALQPVIEALAAADALRPEEKLVWLELPVEEFVTLSIMYAQADDVLAANSNAFPTCADSTLLISEFDALLNELTLWAAEMALFHTYQSDPDDILDAESLKGNALFHMEQAEKLKAVIATTMDNLSAGTLMPPIPPCSDDELSGDYATYLTMSASMVPSMMSQVNVAIDPTSSQLVTLDTFNMTMSDMPEKLPFPVPECTELKLQTIDFYTDMADLAIFGMLTKLAYHMVKAEDTQSALALTAILTDRQEDVMATFAAWGGQGVTDQSAND